MCLHSCRTKNKGAFNGLALQHFRNARPVQLSFGSRCHLTSRSPCAGHWLPLPPSSSSEDWPLDYPPNGGNGHSQATRFLREVPGSGGAALSRHPEAVQHVQSCVPHAAPRGTGRTDGCSPKPAMPCPGKRHLYFPF